jgi:hypothetical protein
MMEWKPITFRPREGPKMRKQDDVKHDLKVVRTYHWEKQAKTRKEYKRIIEQTKTHRESYRHQKKKNQMKAMEVLRESNCWHEMERTGESSFMSQLLYHWERGDDAVCGEQKYLLLPPPQPLQREKCD